MIPNVTCPECEQGKHRNCTLTVLLDDDIETQCVCAAFEHNPLIVESLASAALDDAERAHGAHTGRPADWRDER